MICKVRLAYFGGGSEALHATFFEPQRRMAELLHMVHAVRREEERASGREIALHPLDTFFLKRFVTDSEHLVGDQNGRRQRGRDSETIPEE
jgi:hypothetical protein